jgi:hypothetical protein
VYTYIEPTLRKVFSAPLGETAGTIATSGLSVVAFLIHPLGGSLVGPFRAAGALGACFWRWAKAEDPPSRAANGADCVGKTIRQYLVRCLKITDPRNGPRTADACVPVVPDEAPDAHSIP